ncbi:adenosylcobinamide-GDP ribazoletransferase [Leptotrichia trevisanii]|uniref:Adenosylcobinamide-GDP ribazoletransferase n=1 Tax=Leptotrichia trevisanii TaxID=109328 RepID=A0A510JY74_9FUSO|nr:adenosylcobinamide-GDP ribazoletransferase [Leptotrichia trevisanii]BBM44340.1 cobalamin synthase [Leptotrichia trevisanii]
MKYIKNFFEQFIILIQFMTRIPIPLKVSYSEKKLGKSIKFFPLVGLIIGLILYFTNFLIITYLKNIFCSKIIIAIFLTIVEILIVGIIHIDGLADTFDGLFSYGRKERMLEIMKDSRIGTNGTVVLILYFITKITIISEIITTNPKYLIIFPIVARLSTSVNAGLSDYARKSGMSNAIISENGIFEVIFSLILTNILVFPIIGTNGTVTVFIALLFIILLMLNVRKKIGGITGDTMGASLELTSILVLFLGIILR